MHVVAGAGGVAGGSAGAGTVGGPDAREKRHVSRCRTGLCRGMPKQHACSWSWALRVVICRGARHRHIPAVSRVTQDANRTPRPQDTGTSLRSLRRAGSHARTHELVFDTSKESGITNLGWRQGSSEASTAELGPRGTSVSATPGSRCYTGCRRDLWALGVSQSAPSRATM
jgi:hypothetical protein